MNKSISVQQRTNIKWFIVNTSEREQETTIKMICDVVFLIVALLFEWNDFSPIVAVKLVLHFKIKR